LATIEAFFVDWEHRLPADRGARIVVKPNLNNDLVALTGNCVDLRVLEGIFASLRRRGYRDITLADGSNVGIERRNINTFTRLRVQAVCERHGVRVVDLNHDAGVPVMLHAGGQPQISRTVMESDFLLSVPKIKTHAEAGLSCAMKNWVGIARGQDKRKMHYDLSRNIMALNEVVLPDLILVDGLVGMEGNGPGDGEPFRFGQLLMSDNAFLNDRVVARLVGLAIDQVPYLVHAREAGHLTAELEAEIDRVVPVIRPIRPAPPRSRLAELSEARSLLWLKRMVQPLVAKPAVAELAYKLSITQDVYSLADDTLKLVGRKGEDCGDCRRCEDFCPTGLKREEIGIRTEAPDCVQCLYCWWVCPQKALTLSGEANYLERQIQRYKPVIEAL
jgi:uncharacterized protein (DUF362 family)/NAD-dependent dihydropyrimidine dehydrogenase PreA subunit